MKKIKLHLFALVVILASSCSKDDNASVTSPTPIAFVDEAPVSGKFTKNVLIEDYTGTWCGWCPRVAYSIGKVEEVTTRSVAVAFHGGSSTEPMKYTGTLAATIAGYPTAMLNRTTEWNYPENANITQAKNLSRNNVGLGLAMNSTVTGGNINLDVNIKFVDNYTNVKLVVYALEDNLIYDQTNYTSFYGGVSTIAGFRHDNVVRQVFTSVTGDALTGTTANQTVTKNFTVSVPSNITNVVNMHFVAFVIGADGAAINVRKSATNINQPFEQNP
ncbi:Omp28-related outer membrane protein [Flavobacterium sp.]|uniref:Omp28-related outer membrane protein n=1 Tax=Flavobacterium sp. TaxID=239 RepID=UPI0038FD2386